MRTPLVVPDASVILKWVLPSDDEPDAEKARLLRNAIRDAKVRALLPSLWLYEVGNTIARRYPSHAAEWLTALTKFGLRESSASGRWLTKALELADRYSVSFYDAAYHAIAIVHDGLFVTSDTRYVNRVHEVGAVIALGDWQPPRATARRGG